MFFRPYLFFCRTIQGGIKEFSGSERRWQDKGRHLCEKYLKRDNTTGCGNETTRR